MTAVLNRRTLLGLTATSAAVVLAGCGGNVGGGGGDTATGADAPADAGSGSDFPTDDITLTVGQDAGGSTDLIARTTAEGMAEALGVAVPVVNKSGANGALATQEVAGMEPDGYNLILLNASLITITPLAVAEGEAVTLDQLDVLKGLSQDDYVLVASAESGFTSLDDVIGASGSLTFGTTGVGTGSQLSQAVLFAQAGVEGTAVPFDSGSPALTAVMGNQVQVATIQLGEAKPQIDAGTVVPIVAFSRERNPYLPEVPTAIESGFEVPVSQFRAIAAPKGLPEDVKTALVDAIDAALATEEYQSFNEQQLLTPHEISGEEVVAEWTELADTYQALTEEHGISLAGE
jgi:tripartite-type tricarboxylate transporter receptor subunit TctC